MLGSLALLVVLVGVALAVRRYLPALWARFMDRVTELLLRVR